MKRTVVVSHDAYLTRKRVKLSKVFWGVKGGDFSKKPPLSPKAKSIFIIAMLLILNAVVLFSQPRTHGGAFSRFAAGGAFVSQPRTHGGAFSRFAAGVAVVSQLKTAKLISTFDDKDKHYIDTVYCREKYETTFIIPPNRKIKKVVTGDPDEWEIAGKYGGRIVSVKPLQEAGQTSLTIITQSLKVYKFNIVNIMAVKNPGFDVIAIVEIREKSSAMEVITRESAAVDEIKHRAEEGFSDRRYVEKKKEETIINLNYDYRWKDKYFAIENVYDDGIFTYIVMTRTQEFPAVYISKGKKKKRKNLEPIKYVVKSGLIVIHRILPGKEIFVLRVGSGRDRKESTIYRKKRRKR